MAEMSRETTTIKLRLCEVDCAVHTSFFHVGWLTGDWNWKQILKLEMEGTSTISATDLGAGFPKDFMEFFWKF